ncbi:putative spermidine/putrescine transport system ATP-binding protein [Fusobacterium naviforme]|nr:ABC transporter ATP-binding protein [Fusobacterium naviforme]PSL09938.1 putative spermidine/putrescine transport system ATP-binding protein [Fusobacterium naviforme]STO27902.1 Spermidine/putrescine import ATP-binding protein PotA [Fusobacterium naviforme]
MGLCVELQNITTSYGGPHILSDLSMRIGKGELLSLLGASGCGKTTLLRVIAGLHQVSSGEILFDGVSVKGLRPGQRGIGMLFQERRLLPAITVRENLEICMRPGGLSGDRLRAEAEQYLRLFRMEDYGDTCPEELSGGQQQRVALARAFCMKPRLLLLDEPFTGLDEVLREELSVQLRLLQKRHGITTLLVTHDRAEAQRISDRVLLMEQRDRTEFKELL